MVPTREIYGNIVGGEWVYAFMAVSFGHPRLGALPTLPGCGCRAARKTV